MARKIINRIHCNLASAYSVAVARHMARKIINRIGYQKNEKRREEKYPSRIAQHGP
jgi:hypothetical protein